MIKTNAMRFLDTHKCAYDVFEYETSGFIEVSEVARKIGKAPESVFKTLVTVSASTKKIYVFVVPAGFNLDLKKAARACGEKSVEMLSMKLLLPTIGYIHGGCSPIGMKKNFPVYIDSSAQTQSKIYLSAGKVGVSVGLSPIELATAIQAQFADVKS